jgi:hypothetical protein
VTPAEIDTAAQQRVAQELSFRAKQLRRATRDDALPQLNADENAIRTRAAELYDELVPDAPAIWNKKGDGHGE